jgi:hypothetical protein
MSPVALPDQCSQKYLQSTTTAAACSSDAVAASRGYRKEREYAAMRAVGACADFGGSDAETGGEATVPTQSEVFKCAAGWEPAGVFP